MIQLNYHLRDDLSFIRSFWIFWENTKMDYAQRKNRLLSFLFDLLITLGVSMGIFSFTIFSFHIDISYYLLISIFACYFLYILGVSILLKISKGMTLGGLIFNVRITQTKNRRLSAKQLLIRTSLQGLLPFVLLDILYLYKHDTNLSVIDKITSTLVVNR